MNRNEAVLVMQDILSNFTGKWIDSFVLRKSAGSEADGYELWIKGTINSVSIRRIREISEEHRLCVKDDNGLVIYEPSRVYVDSGCIIQTHN